LAVVGIDDRTLDDLDERFPFRRRHHAAVLRQLRKAGARVVAYDVEFLEPTTTFDDNALIRALAAAPRVVLAASETDGRGRTGVLGGGGLPEEIGARVGHSDVNADGDGVLRRFSPAYGGLRTFAVAVAERITRGGAGDVRDGTLIDWIGGPGAIPTYSFVDVAEGRVPPARLRGRIVVVGATSPVLKDVHTTPMDDGRPLPGPVVQANAIATALRGAPLREAPGVVGVLLTALAAGVAPLAARRLGAFGTLGIAAAAAVVMVGAVYATFLADRVVPLVEPLFALALGTLGAVAAGAAFEAVERGRTREIFARFVSEDVVDDVLARTDDDVRLGGVRVDATVLFCDLRGSTALLEGLQPERGIAVLNVFLGAMGDAVDAHGGTLVGYRGDGLMAVFGAPLPQADHADRAVACAREMAGPALERCHRALRADGVERALRLGVGVASGEVMAGNVGSERRMEYTAIGDAANVAARLEGLTKAYGRPVLIAASTVGRLATADGLDGLGPLVVRGRAATVEVWAADGAGG
jgi:adenylate cyclase